MLNGKDQILELVHVVEQCCNGGHFKGWQWGGKGQQKGVEERRKNVNIKDYDEVLNADKKVLNGAEGVVKSDVEALKGDD